MDKQQDTEKFVLISDPLNGSLWYQNFTYSPGIEIDLYGINRDEIEKQDKPG